MDWQQAQKELIIQLTPLYGDREAAGIADWVMENLSGWKKIDRLLHRSETLSPETATTYARYTKELLAHRPVQYVLHESWFAGMKLYVDENVLIPRPETEELVEWVAETLSSGPTTNSAALGSNPGPHITPNPATALGSGSPNSAPYTPPLAPSPNLPAQASPILLDVGTGSGCIAIALAKLLPSANVHACDISPEALAVARRNALTQNAPLTFHEANFLDSAAWSTLPPVTCLVSNPPYIPLREKAAMAPHVIGFEPDKALFVPDDDALVFYRALSDFAQSRLTAGARIFVEIHEEMGQPVLALFRNAGFKDILLRQDLQGKDRMIKATR
jgi:release factor glutamine methyltransferase